MARAELQYHPAEYDSQWGIGAAPRGWSAFKVEFALKNAFFSVKRCLLKPSSFLNTGRWASDLYQDPGQRRAILQKQFHSPPMVGVKKNLKDLKGAPGIGTQESGGLVQPCPRRWCRCSATSRGQRACHPSCSSTPLQG